MTLDGKIINYIFSLKSTLFQFCFISVTKFDKLCVIQVMNDDLKNVNILKWNNLIERVSSSRPKSHSSGKNQSSSAAGKISSGEKKKSKEITQRVKKEGKRKWLF